MRASLRSATRSTARQAARMSTLRGRYAVGLAGHVYSPRKETDLSFDSMSLLMATRSASTWVRVAADLDSAPENAAVAYLPDREVRVRGI
jgi:hypothetical protein